MITVAEFLGLASALTSLISTIYTAATMASEWEGKCMELANRVQLLENIGSTLQSAAAYDRNTARALSRLHKALRSALELVRSCGPGKRKRGIIHKVWSFCSAKKNNAKFDDVSNAISSCERDLQYALQVQAAALKQIVHHHHHHHHYVERRDSSRRQRLLPAPGAPAAAPRGRVAVAGPLPHRGDRVGPAANARPMRPARRTTSAPTPGVAVPGHPRAPPQPRASAVPRHRGHRVTARAIASRYGRPSASATPAA